MRFLSGKKGFFGPRKFRDMSQTSLGDLVFMFTLSKVGQTVARL